MQMSTRFRTSMMIAVAACVAAGWSTTSLAKEDKPDFPEFEKVTEGMKTIEGFVPLYRDAKKDKLYARIPGGLIGNSFLLATTITKGPMAGQQWVDAPVYWERIDKTMVLMAAETRYKKGGGGPVDDVIGRTYTDSIITSVPILTEAGGDPVIDLASLLKADLVSVGRMYGGGVNASLSRFGEVKNFKHNTEIGVDLVLGGGRQVGVHFSLSQLPSNDYQPRVADDRIGYFLTAVKDWTTDHDADTVFKRYIHRWRLRKVEPGEMVSDVRPEDQIVFYIEKTVPVKYRRFVREGILEWNKAFEAAGLRDAIVVHQQTDEVHAKKDPADVQYNFVRWIVSGTPFAMGPSRVNPFTGQILDADIIFDDSYIRYFHQEYDVQGPRGEDALLDEFEWHHPDWATDVSPIAGQPETPDPAQTLVDLRRDLAISWGQTPDCAVCRQGRGMCRQLGLASAVAGLRGNPKLTDEFIGQAIKETVMHEVGHTLGLRHNFKASSWLSLEEIQQRDPGEPTTASVMDYNPYIFAEQTGEQGAFATPTLGPYDYWAIEYGYRTHVASSEEGAPSNEKEMLAQIAARCAEDGLSYATDEDTSYLAPDPSANRWDNTDDPVAFGRHRIDVARKLWAQGLDWAVDDGESLARLRRVFHMLLGEYIQAGRLAARQVGGVHIYRDHKGDPNAHPPMVPVPAAEQRKALDFLGEMIFSDANFQFPPELLNQLAAGRWMHWDSDQRDSDLAYNVHSRVAAVRRATLSQLLSPFTLNRIYDVQMLIPEDQDALTIPELLGTLTATIWSELRTVNDSSDKVFTNREPMITSFRRDLQRYYVERLTHVVLSRPGYRLYPDAHSAVRQSLSRLSHKIGRTLKSRGDRLDDFTRAHLEVTRSRIQRALAAAYEAQ